MLSDHPCSCPSLTEDTIGFRNIISADNPIFKPEVGRYHLYVSYACPWASRCLIVRHLKGLEEVIGLSVVHPTWQLTKPDIDNHSGWVFRSPDDLPVIPMSGHGKIPCDGCIPDSLTGSLTVRQIYEKSNDKLGKYSVPLLWDNQCNKIVNNESAEIVRMLNSAFSIFGKPVEGDVDLYPESNSDLCAKIDETNEWVNTYITSGVYKCGNAKTQEAYDAASHDLFTSLDRVENILSSQRYLCSSTQLTEADVRLYTILVRFDEVYSVYFKCNCRLIREYPNMRNYLRDLYQRPSFRETTVMSHIKAHYFTSHPTQNPYSVIPLGANTERDLLLPHDRNREY